MMNYQDMLDSWNRFLKRLSLVVHNMCFVTGCLAFLSLVSLPYYYAQSPSAAAVSGSLFAGILSFVLINALGTALRYCIWGDIMLFPRWTLDAYFADAPTGKSAGAVVAEVGSSPEAAAAPGDAEGVTGIWDVDIDSSYGAVPAVFNLTENDGALTGTFEGSMFPAMDIEEGTIAGNEAEWKASASEPMPMTLEFAVAFDGDSVAGEVNLGDFGNGQISGARRGSSAAAVRSEASSSRKTDEEGDVYERLAEKLDQLPPGFPSTDDGIELKILRKVFTPEEAEMASNLSFLPDTAEAVAERLGKTPEETKALLDDMLKKGQIRGGSYSGRTIYALSPWMPGLFEMQMWAGGDKEFTELSEAYLPEYMKGAGANGPAIARVIPAEKHIDPDSQVQRYEDVRKVAEQAKSFWVHECACRKEKAIEGKACDHSIDNCLEMSPLEAGLDEPSPSGTAGRAISKEEALRILDESAEAGLVHNGMLNSREGIGWICNCCSCCCGLLRGAKMAPYVVARSNYVALIDKDGCTGNSCGICAEERCPVGAIVEDDDKYRVLPDTCIGCGACTVSCPTEAIALVRRHESEQDSPPDDTSDWITKRLESRPTEPQMG